MPGLAGASRLRACFAYLLGAALAVGLLAGPWFAALMREFGNPAFPLLNAWFRSPHALPINLIGEAFAVRDPIALLAFPFRMLALHPNIYCENFAPVLRFAALVAALLGLAVLPSRRR